MTFCAPNKSHEPQKLKWLHNKTNKMHHPFNKINIIKYHIAGFVTRNGPYSLLVRNSFYFYSVHAQFTSITLSFEKSAGGVGIFLLFVLQLL